VASGLQRARRLDPGRVVLLKTPWRDGTTHLRFEPLTLLERLAVLTARPRVDVLLYHGILAPHAAGRTAAVAYGRPASADRPHGHAPGATPAAEAVPAPPASPDAAEPSISPAVAAALRLPHAVAPESAAVTVPPADPPAAAVRSPRWRWADLLQRVFSVDVLACRRCGGRMRVLATIDDPRVVRRILSHLGLLGDAGPPPRPAPWRAA
jgi:hypothetical protein